MIRTVLTPGNSHDHARCKVRGCPVVLPEDTFTEWGQSDFLMASCGRPTTIPQHDHFPLQLSLPISGSCLHWFGPKRSVILTEGEAAFIPSGETHGTSKIATGELLTITAELEWCEEHCDVAAAALRRAKLSTVSGKALQGILWRASALLRARDRDELYIGSIGFTVMLDVFYQLGLWPQRRMALNSPGRLRGVVRWIDEHLGEKVTLANLASLAHCSQFHLIRLFDRFVGTSPAKYVMERRLKKSRELLRLPGADISETALVCGFASQSHFTRAFVRRYGVPPGAYRTKRQSAGLGFPS